MILPPRALPTPLQQELLDAIFAEPGLARAAWERWIGSVDLDILEGDSVRFLPLLPARLCELDIDHPESARLRGIHRKSWMANVLRFSRVTPLISLLARADIPVMALKGAAIGPCHYPDHGQRFMTDIDLLVPREKIREVWGLLEGAGWRARSLHNPWRLSRVWVRHSDSFQDGSGNEFDLHWLSLEESVHTAVDQHFWEASVAGTIGGEAVRLPCTSDLLLHIMTHGTRADEGNTIRWIADAVILLRHPRAAIDWHRFITLARELQVAHALGAGLQYLRGRYCPEAIPDETIEELLAPPMTAFEKMQYRINALPWSGGRNLQYLWLTYLRCSNQTRRPRWRRSPLRFIPFLRDYFVLDSAWQLPGYLAGKVLARLKRRISRGRGGALSIAHR